MLLYLPAVPKYPDLHVVQECDLSLFVADNWEAELAS